MSSIYYKHLNNRQLQSWYIVEIEQKGSSKFVHFHSKLHISKITSPTFSWSVSFTDNQILEDKDLISWVINKYGNVWI